MSQYQSVKRIRFVPKTEYLLKKIKLRNLGYKYTMTLYGKVFQGGVMRTKRIEILDKGQITQAENAFLYETMVRQDLNSPLVAAYHAKHPILNRARFRGPPREDYLVLTWKELLEGDYMAMEGQWVEYEQETE